MGIIKSMKNKLRKIIKTIYNCFPFKKYIFIVIKFLFNPSQDIYKHLHFKGIFRVKINESNSFLIQHYGYELENDLFWKGLEDGWEKTSIKLWQLLSKNANVIFDIGANTGLYSLISKTINPDADVHCFEPIPKVFDKLKNNVNINKYNIHCIQKAVSDCTGSAIIYLPKNYEHVYSVTVNKNLNNNPTIDLECFEITTITLYDYIQQNNIKKIDLMKIDVETHEFEVLTGMKEYLFSMYPTLLIEILNNDIAEKINRLLKDSDYLFFDIDDKTGIISKKDKIEKSSFYNYLICTQSVAEYLKLI